MLESSYLYWNAIICGLGLRFNFHMFYTDLFSCYQNSNSEAVKLFLRLFRSLRPMKSLAWMLGRLISETVSENSLEIMTLTITCVWRVEFSSERGWGWASALRGFTSWFTCFCRLSECSPHFHCDVVWSTFCGCQHRSLSSCCPRNVFIDRIRRGCLVCKSRSWGLGSPFTQLLILFGDYLISTSV